MLKLLLTISLATATVAQQEIWVEPVLGADTNLGTYDQPLRSLTAAVGLAGPGARIHLQAGVYGVQQTGELLPISLGAIPQQGLVIRGLGNAVLDLNGGTSTVFRMINGADGARITGLTIRNSDQLGWWTRAISTGSGVNSANSAMNVEIDRCRFENLNRVFVFWTSDNVTGWRVHDNLFVNCSNDAILEYTGTNAFFHNTFHTGLYKAYISDSITSTFTNNLIVAYNIAFENNTAGAPLSRYQGNWLYQCTTNFAGQGMQGTFPPTNVIGQDPQLVNPAGGDYHVQPTSPTLDAGVTPPFARGDLDNSARLVDADLDGALEADVGCYEQSPLHLAATWDPQTMLMWFNGTSTIPGAYGFVVFSFDDGLITFPGQGPILVDQATLIPFFLQGGLPQQWALAFPGYVWPPGQRLVTQILGVAPNHVGGAFFGGNQVWTNF
jgi:hypothetical protein